MRDSPPARHSPLVEFAPDAEFTLETLPYGVFVRPDAAAPRVGVPIADRVRDLALLEQAGIFANCLPTTRSVFESDTLHAFMALGPHVWRSVRARVADLLTGRATELTSAPRLAAAALPALVDVRLRRPIDPPDYTDFYSSIHHARNVGRMFRGEANALPPNYVHLPIAYHGRAGTVVVSGTEIVRPRGQARPSPDAPPVFRPTRELDYELELGFVIGVASGLGAPIGIDQALDHVFGCVLVNDWSARDIQRFEYQPLGPFCGKNFATSISPWVVPLEALAPVARPRPEQSPPPLDHLRGDEDVLFDIRLEAELLAAGEQEALSMCRTNARHMHWSPAQQIAHHTSGGCALRTGDLLASGTLSGPEPHERACMLERTENGAEPLMTPGGATRSYLLDGDRVTLRGAAVSDAGRVGFGEVSGVVRPAVE